MSTKYLILLHLPIVLCLCIMCFQAFKLGFKEFYFLFLGFGTNLLYLCLNILFIFDESFVQNDQLKLTIITTVDLFSMYFFLSAVLPSFRSGGRISKVALFLNKRRVILVSILVVAGIAKTFPGSTKFIPHIHSRYILVAIVDCMTLCLIAVFFKNLSKKFNSTSGKFPTSGYILCYSTIGYGLIQILSIAQRDTFQPEAWLVVENIGFSLGLFFKTMILIGLSILTVNAVYKSFLRESEVAKEKDGFLKNISAAFDDIFNVNDKTASDLNEYEDSIIELVLKQILILLKAELGTYSSYNEKDHKLKIRFTSESYSYRQDFEYPDNIGITGAAISTQKHELMNRRSDKPYYQKYDNYGEEKNQHENINSAIAFPIIIDEKIHGVYLVESEKEDRFSDLDIRIIKSIIKQAATVIKNIRLIRTDKHVSSFIEILKRIDEDIVHGEDVESTLDYILQESLKIVKCESGNIDLVLDNKQLKCIANTYPDGKNKIRDIQSSLSGVAVLEKTTKYFSDLNYIDEKYQGKYKESFEEGRIFQSELIVPLIVKNDVIGIFNTESEHPDNFKPEDIKKMESFAAQAAVAVYVARLLDNLNKHRKSILALEDIDLLILNQAQNLNDTLDAILKKGLELVNQEYGEILLLEEEKQEYFIIKKSVNPEDEDKTWPLDSICGMAIKKNKPVYFPYIGVDEPSLADISGDDVFLITDKEKALYSSPSWGNKKSEIVLPLKINEKAIGVFNIESDEYNAFSQDDRNVLKTLAHAAAIAIYNAHQYEKLAKSIDIENIETAKIFGRVINHTIGNHIGYIKTKLENEFLKGEYGEFNDSVVGEFENMLDSVRTVLAAHKEMRKHKLLRIKSELINFNVVKENIKNYPGLINATNITYSIIGFEKLSPIYMNMNLFMEGIINELVNNSIKSMPSGGKLIIEGKEVDKFNIFTFTDTGCGISKDNREKIFNEGYSEWPSGKSSGIGLFELKNFVESFGGQVGVDSIEGQGTTFTIRLYTTKTMNN